jgi:hypothetical protein
VGWGGRSRSGEGELLKEERTAQPPNLPKNKAHIYISTYTVSQQRSRCVAHFCVVRMWREIKILAFLCLNRAALRTRASESDCSRSHSRIIRQLLQKDFFYQLKDPSKLPEDCPLNPINDLYLEQEKHKFQTNNGNIRCQYCSKVLLFDDLPTLLTLCHSLSAFQEFRNDFYMDRSHAPFLFTAIS